MVTTKSHYHGKHIYIYFTGNRYTFLHIKQCESQNESKKKNNITSRTDNIYTWYKYNYVQHPGLCQQCKTAP